MQSIGGRSLESALACLVGAAPHLELLKGVCAGSQAVATNGRICIPAETGGLCMHMHTPCWSVDRPQHINFIKGSALSFTRPIVRPQPGLGLQLVTISDDAPQVTMPVHPHAIAVAKRCHSPTNSECTAIVVSSTDCRYCSARSVPSTAPMSSPYSSQLTTALVKRFATLSTLTAAGQQAKACV